MMNNISVREMEIDFLKLIQMNLDRKEWGKSYVLFTCGGATVTIEMMDYNFSRNKANFRIEVRYNGEHNLYACGEAEYFPKNMSIEQFKTIVYKCVKKITAFELCMIHRRLADDNIDVCKKSGCDILEEDVEEFDMLDEYEELNNCSSSYSQDALDNLLYDVADEWNSKYYYPIRDDWMEDNPLVIKDVNSIIEKIDKYIEDKQ
jgi:hypothetical protein